jgi:lipopolysaccharide transport system ATP-binding protein
MKPIIEVNHLSKKYRTGERKLYLSFRDSLSELIKIPFKKETKLQENEFWALKDISFKIGPGEVIGIIGKNGAGKTTLLKILSRITTPSEGEAILRGRVGSLLEVGTGFHQELTGRENIFLNGAILGMTKKEVQERFKEIVDFSEVEKFLDTPIKRYSSGMKMRLAFSVAAHLNPEILLVDEVLAVGDVEFQKKCLGKMGEISKQGRTVILVSHDMRAIENLCQKVIFLDKGKVSCFSETKKAIKKYLSSIQQIKPVIKFSLDKNKQAQIRQISILNDKDKPDTALENNKPFKIKIVYQFNHNLQYAQAKVFFKSNLGQSLFVTGENDLKEKKSIKKGMYEATLFYEPEQQLNFNKREYLLDIKIQAPHGEILDVVKDISISFIDKSESATNINSGRGNLDNHLIFRPNWIVNKKNNI